MPGSDPVESRGLQALREFTDTGDRAQMEIIDGVVEKIIYSNADNGYTVCEISHMGGSITAVGYMPLLNEGDGVRLTGAWTNHREYGEQFRVGSYDRVIPETTEAIEKYLASGIIRGSGRSQLPKS